MFDELTAEKSSVICSLEALFLTQSIKSELAGKPGTTVKHTASNAGLFKLCQTSNVGNMPSGLLMGRLKRFMA